MDGLQWFYLVTILFCALAGGYLPFTRTHLSRGDKGFPKSEAFSSGVFLALSLMMLLPSASAVYRQALPTVDFPIASFVALVAFLVLLAIEHLMGHAFEDLLPTEEGARIPGMIPLLMTALIAAPSFFLGAALGASDRTAAALIFVAVILHKSTAAFAIALTTTRSTLTRRHSLMLFMCFALSTPLGIICGGMVGEYLTSSALLFRATVLAVGAGTFLYMGTLHEMKRATLIKHCCNLDCFAAMLAGLSITAIVRWIVGEAHHF